MSVADLQRRRSVASQALHSFLIGTIHGPAIALPAPLVDEIRSIRTSAHDHALPDPSATFSPGDAVDLISLVVGQAPPPRSSCILWTVQLNDDVDVLDFIRAEILKHLELTERSQTGGGRITIFRILGRPLALIGVAVQLQTLLEETRSPLRALLLNQLLPTPANLRTLLEILERGRDFLLLTPRPLDRPIILFGQDPDGPPQWHDPLRSAASRAPRRSVDLVDPPPEAETDRPRKPRATDGPRSLHWRADRDAKLVDVGDSELGHVFQVREGDVPWAVLLALHTLSFGGNRSVPWTRMIETVDALLASCRTASIKGDAATRSKTSIAPTDQASVWSETDEGRHDGSSSSNPGRRIARSGANTSYADLKPETAVNRLRSSLSRIKNAPAGRDWYAYWIHDRGGEIRLGPPEPSSQAS